MQQRSSDTIHTCAQGAEAMFVHRRHMYQSNIRLYNFLIEQLWNFMKEYGIVITTSLAYSFAYIAAHEKGI